MTQHHVEKNEANQKGARIGDGFYFFKLPRNIVVFSYKQGASTQILSGA